VTDLPFEFDEIGYWSELKLDIVEKYGAAYTRTFANFFSRNIISTASAVLAFTFLKPLVIRSMAAQHGP
jgi:hypothetical protein